MKKVSISLLLLVFALTSVAFATGKHKYKLHRWWENDEITKAAGISGQQISKLGVINTNYQEKLKALRSEKKALKQELYDLMGDPKTTNETIKAKHSEYTAKIVEFKELKLEKKLEMRSVLNADQIVKLSDILKQKWEAHKTHKAGKECSYKEGKECSYKGKKEGCAYKDKK